VGLEMSGTAAAFPRHAREHEPWRQDRHLGIPIAEVAIDWRTVIFRMLTVKGIYGREMYGDVVQDDGDARIGLDITPVITHRYHYTELSAARSDGIRNSAKYSELE